MVRFDFNRQMVIEGHLQALVNELTLKVERLERSKAAYKGWKTKRYKQSTVNKNINKNL